MQEKLEKGWQRILSDYFNTASCSALMKRVTTSYQNTRITVYPEQQEVFRAFNETPLNSIKIVILGQDPYHGAGQAHGLAFSVPSGMPAPPSLKNIFKEVQADTNHQIKQRSLASLFETDLSRWSKQGVFLLNSVLTVEAGKPASHANIGWEEFTDHVISTISETQEHVVFMLWGNYAQGKKKLIDTKKHLILEAPHPSPLSAYRGFLGCKHFSKANKYLKKHNRQEIIWQ